jgi:hypothetical protein
VAFDFKRLGATEQTTTYDHAVARMERDIFERVDHDCRGHDVDFVLGVLVSRLEGRLPGVDIDERLVQLVSEQISHGTLKVNRRR